MRNGVIFFILLLSCAGLRAQEQEADISKKLQSRNANLASTLFQNKSFTGDGSFNGAGKANVKSFYFSQLFHPKFLSTQSFLGTKDHWAGDFKYRTDQAYIGHNIIPNATKDYGTKTSETKPARESNKESATNTYANTREYRGQGRSQDRLTREGPNALQGAVPLGMQGNLHPMTIAEVRELLNKNK